VPTLIIELLGPRRSLSSGRPCFSWGRPSLVWLLALLIVACSGSEPDDGPSSGVAEDRGWPLGSPVDTVLAYAAGTPDQLGLPGTFESLVGWRPAGLAQERTAVMGLLDQSVMGGLVGLALPVDDPAALRSSLEQSQSVEFLSDGPDEKRFVLTVPAESPLVNFIRAVRAMGNTGSISEMMAAIGQPVSVTSTWELSFRDGLALLVPSFEAAYVMGKLVEQMPVQGEGTEAPMVLSLDRDRLELSYYDEFQESRRQVDALLSGDPEAGPAGMLDKMFSEKAGEDSSGPRLPIDGPTIAALLEMLAVDLLSAVQLQAQGLPNFDALMNEQAEAEGSAAIQLACKVRWNGSAALTNLLGCFRPPASLGSAEQLGVFSADPDRFPAAFTQWMRPLVEAVHGQGLPADDALTELTQLLSPWGGLLLVTEADGEPLCVATLQPGERLDTQGLLAWFEPILGALDRGKSPAGADLREPDDGETWSPATWSQDDMIVMSSGDEEPMQVEALLDQARAMRGSAHPSQGPFLKLLVDGGQLSVGFTNDVLELELESAGSEQESR
jgi:hypothetical protein